jgi:hypothetical protein
MIEQFSSVDAFEASLLFFPIDPKFGREIAKTIWKLVTENSESRASMFQLLSSIWTQQVPGEHLLTYLLEVRLILTFPESVGFWRVLLDTDFRVSGARAAQFFELFDIAGRAPELWRMAKKMQIKSFALVDRTTQKDFLESIRNELDFLLEIWNQFLAPSSAAFDQGLSDGCGPAMLSHLFAHLRAGREARLKVLEFILNSEALPRRIGANGTTRKWHVCAAIPLMVPLLDEGDADVAAAAKGALKVLRAELRKMVLATPG